MQASSISLINWYNIVDSKDCSAYSVNTPFKKRKMVQSTQLLPPLTAPWYGEAFSPGRTCGNMSQPQFNTLKSGSQKRKVRKDRERRLKWWSPVLTNLVRQKGEHRRLNTQDGTPFWTTAAKTNREPEAGADNRLHCHMTRPWLLKGEFRARVDVGCWVQELRPPSWSGRPLHSGPVHTEPFFG